MTNSSEGNLENEPNCFFHQGRWRRHPNCHDLENPREPRVYPCNSILKTEPRLRTWRQARLLLENNVDISHDICSAGTKCLELEHSYMYFVHTIADDGFGPFRANFAQPIPKKTIYWWTIDRSEATPECSFTCVRYCHKCLTFWSIPNMRNLKHIKCILEPGFSNCVNWIGSRSRHFCFVVHPGHRNLSWVLIMEEGTNGSAG